MERLFWRSYRITEDPYKAAGAVDIEAESVIGKGKARFIIPHPEEKAAWLIRKGNKILVGCSDIGYMDKNLAGIKPEGVFVELVAMDSETGDAAEIYRSHG